MLSARLKIGLFFFGLVISPSLQAENIDFGRDHHPFCFSMVMAGGGLKGGQVYGKTDEIGWSIEENPVHPNDLQATLLHCFGLNHKKLTYRFQGRDFRLTDVAGRVMKYWLS